MTREEMIKTSFKPYMEILYQHPRMEKPIPCLLLQINFDEEEMLLQPYFEGSVNKDFFSGIQHCRLPRKKMKPIYKNGERVKDDNILPFNKGSFGRKNPEFDTDDLPDFDKVS